MKLLLLIINFIALSYQQQQDWYRTASFYQIYPQTFYDGGGGNREGYGTLKGIMEKLDYIESLNVDCIWLTPIFKTSYNAFGYDIIDYEEVDGRFGTKDDFRKLIDAVHAKGMKIIVDFVPNHCGYEHEFFQKSAANDSEYRDWFIWGNGRNNNQDPPSNWQRIGDVPGSAWSRTIEGNEIMTRNEWFMSQFFWNMPDFNLRHPKVVEYWEKFLRYWLNFKLDGFRIDAISHGFEVLANEDGTFPDEAINPDVSDPKNFGYLHHNLTQDLPELFQLIFDWRDILDEFNDTQRIMMTESYANAETIMKFYRNADNTRKGSHLPFNFEFIKNVNNETTATDIVRIVNNWFSLLPSGEVTNWAIGNHDQPRVASRFGTDRIDIFNVLVTMLPGTSVTYYGEEIGMKDTCVLYNSDHNMAGSYCTETQRDKSDAWNRTPMQWNNSTNAGFTTSSKPWLPIGSDYLEVNVAAQQNKAGSHLEIFKQLQKMRKSVAIQNGTDFKMVTLSEQAFAFKREFAHESVESVLVVINFGSEAQEVNIREKLELQNSPTHAKVKITGTKSAFKADDLLALNEKITLGAFESIVAVYNHSMAMAISKVVLLLSFVILIVAKTIFI